MKSRAKKLGVHGLFILGLGVNHCGKQCIRYSLQQGLLYTTYVKVVAESRSTRSNFRKTFI